MNIILLGNCDNPDAFKVVIVSELFRICLEFIGDIFDLTVDLDKRTDGEDLFDRTLCDQLALAVLVFEHNTHPSAREVKRDLVFSYISLLKERELFLLGTVDDRNIHEVLKTCLEVTVEESMP